MTDEDIAGSNSDTESIPYKERYGKWNVENENISKGRKEPVAHTTLNIGGEKVDTQTSESHTISATPGNLLKQPGEKNRENNVNNRDSYTPQEKVMSPVRLASFSGRWDSAQTAYVPKETKDSRENPGRSRSKTRKSRRRKYQSSSSSLSSLTSSSPSSDSSESETSSSSSSSDSERTKRKKK